MVILKLDYIFNVIAPILLFLFRVRMSQKNCFLYILLDLFGGIAPLYLKKIQRMNRNLLGNNVMFFQKTKFFSLKY